MSAPAPAPWLAPAFPPTAHEKAVEDFEKCQAEGRLWCYNNELTDSYVISAIAVAGAAGVLLMLAFGCVRWMPTYKMRLNLAEKIIPPPALPLGGFRQLWSWLGPVLRTSDADLARTAGLDSLMLVWTQMLGIQLFLPLTVVGLAVLLPINLKLGGRQRDGATAAGNDGFHFVSLTVSNLGWSSPLYWVAFVFCYAVVAYCCWLLVKYYQSYCILRQRYLLGGEALVNEWAPTRGSPEGAEEGEAEPQGRLWSNNAFFDAVSNLFTSSKPAGDNLSLEATSMSSQNLRGAYRQMMASRRISRSSDTSRVTSSALDSMPSHGLPGRESSPGALSQGGPVPPSGGPFPAPKGEEAQQQRELLRMQGGGSSGMRRFVRGSSPKAYPEEDAAEPGQDGEGKPRRHSLPEGRSMRWQSAAVRGMLQKAQSIREETTKETETAVRRANERAVVSRHETKKDPGDALRPRPERWWEASRGHPGGRPSVFTRKTINVGSADEPWTVNAQQYCVLVMDVPNLRAKQRQLRAQRQRLQESRLWRLYYTAGAWLAKHVLLRKHVATVRTSAAAPGTLPHGPSPRGASPPGGEAAPPRVSPTGGRALQHKEEEEEGEEEDSGAVSPGAASVTPCSPGSGKAADGGLPPGGLREKFRPQSAPTKRESEGENTPRNAQSPTAEEEFPALKAVPSAFGASPKPPESPGTAWDRAHSVAVKAREAHPQLGNDAPLTTGASSAQQGLLAEQALLQGLQSHLIAGLEEDASPPSRPGRRSSSRGPQPEPEPLSPTAHPPSGLQRPPSGKGTPQGRPQTDAAGRHLNGTGSPRPSKQGRELEDDLAAAMEGDEGDEVAALLAPETLVETTFRRLFPSFQQAVAVRRHKAVELLLYKWDVAFMNLLDAEYAYEQSGAKQRPQHRPRLCGCLGARVDSIDAYAAEVRCLEARIEAEQQRALRAEPSPSFFAFFGTAKEAAIAAQTNLHPEDGHSFNVVEAPGPEEINWECLWQTRRRRTFRDTCTFFLILLLLLFPIGIFVGSLTQLHKQICTAKEGPLSRLRTSWYCDRASWLQAVLTSVVPTLLLMLYQSWIVPLTMYTLALLEGRCWSLSALDKRIAQIYFQWAVVNVFLGAMLGGSIMSQLTVVLNDPYKIPTLIGTGLSTSSNFFINYLVIQAFATVPSLFLYPQWTLCLDLLRLVGIWVPHTGNTAAKARQTCSIRYGRELGNTMLLLLIALGYSAASPLILPFALVYFLGSWLYWRYNILFVSERAYESGGRIFDQFFVHMCWVLFVFEFFTGCIFLANGAYVQATIMIVTLTPALYRFQSHCRSRYGEALAVRKLAKAQAVQHMPLDTAAVAAEATVDPILYTPAALRPGCVGWYPECGKAWENQGSPLYWTF